MPSSKQRCPPGSTTQQVRASEEQMDDVKSPVVIGMDPHKRSVTIEVMTADETVLGGGRYATDEGGFAEMERYVSRFPDRVWAIEGCSGIGHHVAVRLLAAGEEVVDVPPKLSARARVFATGQGRKTDATDAHSIALVGPRMTGLRPVVNDEQLAVLRLLVDRRRSLGEEHTRKTSQLHQLLLELIPGGAKRDLSAAQAKALLAKVRPRDLVGKTRRRVAAELVADLERIYARKKEANKELTELVKATGTTLLDLHGIGPTGAARLLVEVGDITRFPNKAHFASWNGTAPLDASSGDQVRHRLSRKGNRQINRVLHTMARVQLRNPTEGRAYYDRKKADGKAPMEAMRCVKRRLSDIVFQTMLNDAVRATGATTNRGTRTGPGGQRGDDSDSSAAGSQPHTNSSDKSLPGPARQHPRTPLPAAS
ncbi:IS110 family RNA-guided transposase [Nocardioides okcheonensis]|uniref:IS110 family transposase n=1 Tax=Nocardioides okcheonensis TaxID=2894081 RepID=UPI001E477626|nr:IS110 family transposase [Nocardioides okcheonensis]UFN45216.1 IS110 family transposase [Nocardioides okcheonensis]